MHITQAASLCDAIEIGSFQLNQTLSVDDIIAQAMHGIDKEEARKLVREALGVAILRSRCYPEGYPFDVSQNYIEPKQRIGFDPYLFLLLGYAVKRSCIPNGNRLAKRFERYFEDLVCWILRRAGFTAIVLSEPRGERGLARSLKDALAQIATIFGEPASIFNERIKKDDNDLDVDVIASPSVIDRTRCGGPSMFLQCTTSPVERLNMKMAEGYNLFSSVWNNGFFLGSSIRGGATPEDLVSLDSRDWVRLSQTGWVLDRMRLVELSSMNRVEGLEEPESVLNLWNDLWSALPEFDWRGVWGESSGETYA